MTFAKLEHDRLIRCPKTGKIDGKTHSDLPLFFDTHRDVALENGWKELVVMEKPDETCIPVYSETETKIIQNWEIVPPPEPTPDLSRQVDQNTANIEFMAVYLDIPINEMLEVLSDAQ